MRALLVLSIIHFSVYFTTDALLCYSAKNANGLFLEDYDFKECQNALDYCFKFVSPGQEDLQPVVELGCLDTYCSVCISH